MDRDDIIKMAREAGFNPVSYTGANLELFERFAALVAAQFAALVAAAEREACAKVCDVLAVHPEYASDITKVAAQAIRSRGNT